MTQARTIDLAALMEAHQTGVWRYLRALGADPSLADDLTQETFLAALRNPPELRSDAETAGWLRTVARNFFLKACRKRGRTVAVEDVEVLDRDWGSLVRDDAGDLLIEALKRCLEALDDKPRKMLDLRYRDENARVDIAGLLGMTDDGVKTLMRRTKARLRKCVELRTKEPHSEG